MLVGTRTIPVTFTVNDGPSGRPLDTPCVIRAAPAIRGIRIRIEAETAADVQMALVGRRTRSPPRRRDDSGPGGARLSRAGGPSPAGLRQC